MASAPITPRSWTCLACGLETMLMLTRARDAADAARLFSFMRTSLNELLVLEWILDLMPHHGHPQIHG